MSQVSYLALALGVFNLLLAASGLLLVFFDWSAARRREHLYLAFTEEKPGFNYFAAARRRRVQYTRLLMAFSLLFVREFLVAVQYASVSRTQEWTIWLQWWQQRWWNAETFNAIALASDLQIWIVALGVLGIVMLAWGFVYRSDYEGVSLLDGIGALFVACWLLVIVLIVAGRVHESTLPYLHLAGTISRLLVLAGVAYLLIARMDQPLKPGLLTYDAGVIIAVFALWILGITASDWLGSPLLAPISMVGAYLLLVATVGRGVLNEYEMVEGSRHRLGRERQTIVSFLRSIGAAFTTKVEVDDVLKIILDSALETTQAQSGAIYLYSRNEELLETRIVRNFFPPMYVDTPAAYSLHRTEDLEEEMKLQSFKLGEGIIGEVAERGHAQIVNDVSAEGIMLGSTTDYMRNRSMLVVPLRLRDEPLGVMAVLNKGRGSFDFEDRSLLQALADQGALFINNAILTGEVAMQERLRRDLQIARDIQTRLLPDKCPVVPGFEIAARGTSATEVGGDYYDFFWVDETHLGIVVADVSGKGVHAALIAAMIRSAFRTQVRGNADVRLVLSNVNEFISQDLRSDMFITCVYGILDVTERSFSWARAGHEPVIVAHPNHKTDVYTPQGFALGVVDSPDFGDALEVHTIKLEAGDRLLIFTDGLTEAMNNSGEEFGMERVLELLEATPTGNDSTSVATQASSEGEAAEPGGDKKSRVHKMTVESKPKIGKGDGGKETPLSDISPCAPMPSPNEPDELHVLEEAVALHVGNAPQSDDLTIVYLAAK